MNILTVDRNPELQQGVRLLADHHGWTLETAQSAEQALGIRRHFEPDLVLLDYLIFEIYGSTLLDALQEGAEIPAILLLDRVYMARLERLHLPCSCDFLFKPIQAAELKLRIDKLIGEHDERPSCLSFGPIKVDPRLKQVMIAEEKVDLSPKEYELLKLLVEEQGRVVTCQGILERLWEGGPRASVGDVRQYIYLLRNRIKKTIGPFDCVHNDKGFGYRLYCSDCPSCCVNRIEPLARSSR